MVRLAERHTTVHTPGNTGSEKVKEGMLAVLPGSLHTETLEDPFVVEDLFPVMESVFGRVVLVGGACVLDEATLLI
jgi:hypothetical protein